MMMMMMMIIAVVADCGGNRSCQWHIAQAVGKKSSYIHPSSPITTHRF